MPERLCQKLIELNGGNPTAPMTAQTIISFQAETDSLEKAAASSLGYFGVCDACELTLSINPGDPLELQRSVCQMNTPPPTAT